MPRTPRAAITCLPTGYRCLPFVVWTLRAFPPHFLARKRNDIMGRQGTIFRWMPLRRQLWDSCQCVGNGQPSIAAKGAAPPFVDARAEFFGSGEWRGPSLMIRPFRAFPTYGPSRARHHVGRRKITIFGRVPLRRNLWAERRQGLAVRDPGLAPRPTTNRHLPLHLKAAIT